MHDAFRRLETLDVDDPTEPLVEAGVAVRIDGPSVDRPSAYERVLARLVGAARGSLDGLAFAVVTGDVAFERSPWLVELRDGDQIFRAHLEATVAGFDPELLLLLNTVLEHRERPQRAALIAPADADELTPAIVAVVASPEELTQLRRNGITTSHDTPHPRLRQTSPGRYEDRMHDRPLGTEGLADALAKLLPFEPDEVTGLVAEWIDDVSSALRSDSRTIKCPWLGRFALQRRTGVEDTDPAARAPTRRLDLPDVRFTPGRVLRTRLDPANADEEEATISVGPRTVPEALAELLARRQFDAVYVPGLGKFVLSAYRERIGRDPSTKQPVAIPSRSMVHFAPSVRLLESLAP